MYTVDIDVGGTLTDGLFSDGVNAVAVKVDTTPHDLTVCFHDCLEEGASRLGFDDLASFLHQCQVIRWSTTITTNVLAERRGPRLGLLVAEGHKANLYADGGWSPVLALVGADNIIELPLPIDQNAVLRQIKQLLERGVRRVCIALPGAFTRPEDELALKRTIENQYPDHYLGAVPVLLGSEICRHPDDMTRAHYAVINAYVHGPLANTLFKAEDELRDRFGWDHSLLIGHLSGGVARVAKTRAIDTIESGPMLGIHAASFFARQYGLNRVVALDVGGTTVKISLVIDGQPLLADDSELFGIPLKMRFPSLSSIALGGGSVARVEENGTVRLGPESMGAYPGPAAYDLGGSEATLTDAFVVLGYLNPENFLGGSRLLNVENARTAIATQVGDPLGISVEEAATAIVQRAFEMVADHLQKRVRAAGFSPEEFVLFSYGGNGGVFACGTAERAGISEAYIFDLGPVFSAFGSSTSNILHVYEHALFLPLDATGDDGPLYDAISRAGEEARRDMEGEGIDPSQATFLVEIEVRRPDGNLETVQLPLAEATPQVLAGRLGSGTVEMLRLRATSEIRTYAPVPSQGAGGRASAVTHRQINWDGRLDDAPVYEWQSLPAEGWVAGPAILEGAATTYLVAPEWQLQKDEFGNGRLTRKEHL